MKVETSFMVAALCWLFTIVAEGLVLLAMTQNPDGFGPPGFAHNLPAYYTVVSVAVMAAFVGPAGMYLALVSTKEAWL